jgi:hypothetical protein
LEKGSDLAERKRFAVGVVNISGGDGDIAALNQQLFLSKAWISRAPRNPNRGAYAETVCRLPCRSVLRRCESGCQPDNFAALLSGSEREAFAETAHPLPSERVCSHVGRTH